MPTIRTTAPYLGGSPGAKRPAGFRMLHAFLAERVLDLGAVPVVVRTSSRATALAYDSEQEFAMYTASPLRVGQVLEISFPRFKPQITVHSQRELTVEIVAGENIGFSDTVEYEAVVVRDGLVILSWREHIGSTIVHVLDFLSGEAYTAVTPAKGGFLRMMGRMAVKSAT